MNSNRVVLSILLFGSLWGIGELWLGEIALAQDIPRAPLLTAIGVLLLVLSRRIWPAPGSSLALAGVASVFKLLQHPVWGCKLAAVLMVGAVFELGFTLYEARRMRARSATSTSSAPALLGLSALAAALTFASFVLFAYFARDVLHNPFWAIPERMTDYMLVQGPIAAIIAMPAAAGGRLLADRLVETSRRWTSAGRLIFRVAALGSSAAGVVSALVLRY